MKKHKILMLSDFPLCTSGVGTQSRWLINGLLSTGKYRFLCLGAAIKHQTYDLVTVNDDFKILPVDGFGTKELLRELLITEKPDCILLFTDPRFFVWVWEMEDEIHQVCPIAYNHLWDNLPYPKFNEKYYKATDLLNCINWTTYEFLKERFPEKTFYIPHALPEEVYHPIPIEQQRENKKRLFGNPDRFVGLWVNRNAKRKMPGDIMLAWKLFADELEKKHGVKDPLLLMHTDPNDMEGPSLHAIANDLNMTNIVSFSNQRIDFGQMNGLYNSVDFAINRSSAEGFGLGTLEAMYAGKPIIALKTGGLTRQVQNPHNGEEYGVAVDVEVQSLIGTQMVPYIYEDHVSNETMAKAFMKMYEYGPEKRIELGLKGREYVKQEYSIANLISKWDVTLEDLILNWKEKRENFEVISI